MQRTQAELLTLFADGQAAGSITPAHVRDLIESKIQHDDARLTDARTPTTHSHATSEVTGLDTALAGKAASSHTHAQSDITGLSTALAGKAATSHTHATSEVTGLDTALAGKAAAAHTHATSEVTGLDTALAGKAATSHTHADATTSASGFMPAASVTKLNGIATGATANSTDAHLLSRANHTGQQAATTITGLAAVATSGAYTDLSGRPTLATVATTGSYTDLSNRPTFSLVATSGDYNDLLNRPSINSNNLWTTVRKAADTSRSANVTLAADPDLTFTMAANTRYSIRARIYFDTTAAADFKFRTSGPATPTLVRIARSHVVPGTTAMVVAVDVAYSAADVALTGTGTTGGYIDIDAVIVNGATAGAFQFLWAQNTSDAGATIVRAGSYLEWMT
jgi:hypothetical protein